jgi:hypothetical protein
VVITRNFHVFFFSRLCCPPLVETFFPWLGLFFSSPPFFFAGNGLGATIKYLRRTTSGAARNGLGTKIEYLQRITSGAAGNGLGIKIKYLRQTTGSAAGNGLDATIKYLRGAVGIGLYT